MTLAILGGGSWGTALAIVLAPRCDRIRLWVHDPELCRSIQQSRENSVYLAGFQLPRNVTLTSDLAQAVEGAEVVMHVVPSQYFRDIAREALAHSTTGTPFVSATKGLEVSTLLRMSEVIQSLSASTPVAVLSGPTFAREVAAGDPTALVIASSDESLAARVQKAFSGPTFRLYTNDDPAGVEIGAALKNVIAIGAGICDGLGLGGNAVAALVTRGLVEISRLAESLGGKARTLSGLAGLGDLVLTCTGDLSRNRRVGIELGRGRKLTEILAGMSMVAEGVQTSRAAYDLARRQQVQTPILDQMYAVLHKNKQPQDGIKELMERQLRSE